MAIYVLESTVSAQTLIDTLNRAAYHLRKMGYGEEDIRCAERLESMKITDPGLEGVELRVTNLLDITIKRTLLP